ncbi:MAG: MlaD family protein [Deltaproteobacteria bacterium]|nr:MlaD family protein [Deltaproteobacteria bacterium]
MRNTRNAIAVGVVAVVAVVGTYAAIRFVSESGRREGQYRVWAVFKDATGLVERSRVRIAGIPVGSIERISLHEYQPRPGEVDAGPAGPSNMVGARVDILVDRDVALYKDAVAVRSAGSILGEQFVVLVPGRGTQPRLKDGDRIENVRTEGLLGAISDISTDIRQVTKNLRTVFGSQEGGKQMGEILANLHDISASINKLIDQNTEAVNRTLENIDGITAENRPGVRQIVEDLKVITSEVRSFVEKNSNQIGGTIDKADATVVSIQEAVAKLDKTLTALQEIAEGANKGEGTVGRLLKDDKLIDEVEGVASGVGDFVHSVYELKTIVGLSGEFNFYDNTLKSTVQLRLQPREDKYYLIEVINDPRGNTTRTETVVESTNPNEPAQYREVRHETTDEFLFSVMFARRLKFATFRFGIKESSGGLGVDLHFLHDRIELSTDVYRFGEDVYPRLKEMVALEFLRHLFIIGGVNDALNEGRDYFIGAMIRFDDQDLKTILAFSPSVPAGN